MVLRGSVCALGADNLAKLGKACPYKSFRKLQKKRRSRVYSVTTAASRERDSNWLTHEGSAKTAGPGANNCAYSGCR